MTAPRRAREDELLAQMGWVRALARGLVHAREDADDLVQTAWLAALERPPRVADGEDGQRGLRAWLARVVRNALLQARRGAARRERREREAARPEAIGDVVERGALQRELTDAVLALDEPYRSSVLLHYLDGLGVARVAERLGTTPAAVRKRLSRARTLLRARLERAHADDRRWLGALVALAPSSSVERAIAGGTTLGAKAMVAGAVALAVAGAWWTARDAEREEARLAGAAVEGRADGLREAPRESGAERAATAAHARVAVESARNATPTRANAPLVLRVVDAVSGAPLAGTEVLVGLAAFVRGRPFDATPDPETALRARGERHVADAEGLVALAADERARTALARAGERFGLVALGPGAAGTLELALGLERTLRICVVDERGRPVPGVPVRVAADAVAARTEGSGWRGRTGTDGVATLRHVDQVLGERLARAASALALLAIPSAEPVAVELDPRALPSEPVRLVLPACGRVVVDVAGADGAPLDGCLVALTEVRARGDGALAPARGATHRAWTAGGRATFDFVGLGLELACEAAPGVEVASVRRTLQGPAGPGDEVRIALRAAERAPALVGRILGASGAPFADAVVRLSATFADARGRERTVVRSARTDAQGGVRATLDPPELDALRCTLVVSHDDGERAHAAELALVAPLAPGDVPLGDVRLEPVPLAFAGRVFDASGAALAGALVQLVTDRSFSDAAPDWELVHGARATSDARGAFAAWGRFAPGREDALAVTLDGWVQRALAPVVPGRADAVVVLERAGALAGALRLPDGADGTRLRIAVAPRDAHERRTVWRGADTRPSASGRFRLGALPPGEVDVSIALAGDAEPLARVEGVRVPPGGEARVDVDLRGRLGYFRLVVLDASGAPVPEGLVTLHPAGATPRIVELANGAAELLARPTAVDARVDAPGFRSAEVRALAGERTVVLERGIDVRLRLPRELALPDAPGRVQVGLVATDGAAAYFDERVAGGTPRFHWDLARWPAADASREVELVAPGEGRYDVYFVVGYAELGGSWHRAVLGAGEAGSARIEVGTGGGTHDVAPRAQEYARALADLATAMKGENR